MLFGRTAPDETSLATKAEKVESPAWSPDGRRIAYVNRDAGSQIHIMNADGTDDRRLSEGSVCQTGPTWSPDGTRIAFRSCSAPVGLYIVGVDGGEPIPILGATRPEPSGAEPDWSPVLAKGVPSPTATSTVNEGPTPPPVGGMPLDSNLRLLQLESSSHESAPNVRLLSVAAALVVALSLLAVTAGLIARRNGW